jgi:hypothetical protein
VTGTNAIKRHYIGKRPSGGHSFVIPSACVLRDDGAALVYEVRVGPNASLRHYSFPDRWFQVNVSRDGRGALVTEPGPGELAWLQSSFNCDICAPLQSVADGWLSVDLELDVLAAPDGKTYAVKDEAVFADVVAAGFLSRAEADGARKGLAALRVILESSGGLIPFLSDFYSLGLPLR